MILFLASRWPSRVFRQRTRGALFESLGWGPERSASLFFSLLVWMSLSLLQILHQMVILGHFLMRITKLCSWRYFVATLLQLPLHMRLCRTKDVFAAKRKDLMQLHWFMRKIKSYFFSFSFFPKSDYKKIFQFRSEKTFVEDLQFFQNLFVNHKMTRKIKKSNDPESNPPASFPAADSSASHVYISFPRQCTCLSVRNISRDNL